MRQISEKGPDCGCGGTDLDYQFKLDTDGDGAYYNLSEATKGEKIKPDELFSCRKSS